MVICAVDYGQTHIFTSKLFRCLKAAKARADNDDSGLLAYGGLHPAISQQTSKFQPSNAVVILSEAKDLWSFARAPSTQKIRDVSLRST